MKELLDAVKNNLATDPKLYRFKIANRLNSLMQTGHVGKRVLERARKEGVDIQKLLKQGYTIQQITTALNNASKQANNRFGTYKFNIEGPPAQQDFLKNLHQAVPSEKAAIRNYGKHRLEKKRQAATQQALQPGNTLPPPTNYKTRPEPPQPDTYKVLPPPRTKRAARNISDMGFQDWLIHRDS